MHSYTVYKIVMNLGKLWRTFPGKVSEGERMGEGAGVMITPFKNCICLSQIQIKRKNVDHIVVGRK